MHTLLAIMVALVFYAFIGYPLLLLALSLIYKKETTKEICADISVSLIIAAYNEEDVIEAKLLNSIELDYPPCNLEIIVSSDGSTDNTDGIVKRFAESGVILNRVEGRKGKTEAQNQTVKISTGEIIIFSDANALYLPDAIKMIVRNFTDKDVGGVCGKLIYTTQNGMKKDSESAYWDFENLLKERESILGAVIGANGSIYAIRKSCYIPLDCTLISDFVEPLKIVEQGHRFIYEKDAISLEEADTVSGSHAFDRKVRINVRTLLGLYETIGLLNIFKYGWVSIQYFSHKILRYMMPFILILTLTLNLFALDVFFWQLFLAGQVSFYSFGIVGYIRRTCRNQSNIFSLPWYFISVHLAILASFVMLARGDKKTTWDTKRS
ncbi:MAG: glycosyltransferase family 2 protein [Candidatus Polarisedimenticolaceae bacterium]|nr:glycosyltransferase family 2 protein [Candidatus Polarisedimenticolaceae bacterium]